MLAWAGVQRQRLKVQPVFIDAQADWPRDAKPRRSHTMRKSLSLLVLSTSLLLTAGVANADDRRNGYDRSDRIERHYKRDAKHAHRHASRKHRHRHVKRHRDVRHSHNWRYQHRQHRQYARHHYRHDYRHHARGHNCRLKHRHSHYGLAYSLPKHACRCYRL